MDTMTTPPTAPSVEADDLWKRYGHCDVVLGVSLAIQPSQQLGLVGPNGSGKAATTRMVLDIIRPAQGTVMLFGGNMSQATPSRIGYLAEDRSLRQILRTLRSA